MKRRDFVGLLIAAPLAAALPRRAESADTFKVGETTTDVSWNGVKYGPFRYVVLTNQNTCEPICYWEAPEIKRELRKGNAFMLPNPVEVKLSFD